MKKITAYARLLRFPGIAGLAIPPVIGALTVTTPDLLTLVILFIIGALAAIFGFILNDFIDVEVDKLSEELQGRPLVSGDISKTTALLICTLCVLITFFLLFALWYQQILDIYKFRAVSVLFLAWIFGSIYDFYGKKIIGSDVFVALAVSFVFLFGALAVGVPNIVTWIIFILTFNNLLHMNAVEGGIKDADHDPLMGVKNIASASGVKVKGAHISIPNGFKAFGMGIRLFSSILLISPFIIWNYEFYYWQIILLVLGIIIMLYFSLKLLSIKIFNRSKIRKYISIQSFIRYSLVPIMLISIIGIKMSIILIIFPIAWYIVFTPLLGEKLLKPKM
jgi:4-hydroxybenzoate polyprenyltransferase